MTDFPTIIELNIVNEKKALNNVISTVKYSWWSFIFVFIYEQYKQINNIYYLLNAIAGYIVVLITPITNVLPIIFVLVMSAFREIVEDVSRLRADRQSNSVKYRVIRNRAERTVPSSDIRRGDILCLENQQMVPCDSLLLQSGSESGVAYVSTASLDGEVNLKPKVQICDFLKKEDIVELLATVYVAKPSESMTEFNGDFSGESGEKPFSVQNVLLRGARLENTNFAYAGVIYTGKDTRMMQAQVQKNVKSSNMFWRMTQILFYQVLLNIIVMLVFPAISVLTNNTFFGNYMTFQLEERETGPMFLNRFITYFVLMAYLLPVSLFVTLELSRFFASMQIEGDTQLRIPEVNQYQKENPKAKLKNDPHFASMNTYNMSVQAKNYITVENLCEANIIFSDKTGTLTKNKMLLLKAANCQNQQFDVEKIVKMNEKNFYQEKGQFDPKKFDLQLLFQLALCNTVLSQPVELIINGKKQQIVAFQGESPDEVALVNAAKTMGLVLETRNANSINYSLQYQNKAIPVQFKRHGVIPFSSVRKRMSIILEEIGQPYNKELHTDLLKDGFCILQNDLIYCLPQSTAQPGTPFVCAKGADNFVLELCCDIEQEKSQQIEKLLTDYSLDGLRTLVFASKQLPQDQLKLIKQLSILQQLNEDDIKFVEFASQIEANLKYTGITAVEDELQDDVQYTLKFLKEAGIRVWMLTGDKTETAINISRSSGLSSHDSKLIELTKFQLQKLKIDNQERSISKLLDQSILLQKNLINQNSQLQYEKFKQYLQKRQIRQENLNCCKKFLIFWKQLFDCKTLNIEQEQVNCQQQSTIILDSDIFKLIMKHKQQYKLMLLAYYSQSAVCCRMLPAEKAKIVQLTHQLIPQFVTVAMGDGANDVPMIKEAHVGIGIAGKEGMHACNSADITLPELRFIKRVLCVHSRYFHLRFQELFEYAIEKNTIISLLHIAYAFCNLQSVQFLLDSFLLLLFNILITLFPIFFQSITNKDVSDDQLDKYPQLQKHFAFKYRPSGLAMFLRMCRATYYGVIFVALLRYTNANSISNDDGTVSDLNSESFTMYIILLYAVNLEFFVNQTYYTYFTLGAFIFMVIVVVFASWVGCFSSYFGYTLISVPLQMSTQLSFHIKWFFIGLLCALPSIFFETVRQLYFPSQGDINRYKRQSRQCTDPFKESNVYYTTGRSARSKLKHFNIALTPVTHNVVEKEQTVPIAVEPVQTIVIKQHKSKHQE